MVEKIKVGIIGGESALSDATQALEYQIQSVKMANDHACLKTTASVKLLQCVEDHGKPHSGWWCTPGFRWQRLG
jgi:hypothetical protein